MSGYHGSVFTQAYRPGQLVELAFLPSPMWPGFAVADNRIAEIALYKRMFSNLGQKWRLPADTYDSETHFRFPDGQKFRKGAAITPGTPAVPGLEVLRLNDDGSLVASLGFGHAGPAVGADQDTLDYTCTGGGGSKLLMPADAFGAQSFPRPAVDPVIVQADIISRPNSNGLAIVWHNAGALVNAATIAATAPGDELAIIVQTDGTLIGYINGAPAALSYMAGAGSIGAGHKFTFYLQVSEAAAGLRHQIKLKTKAADLTPGYPGSPVSIFTLSQETPATPETSNVGEQGGSTTSAGHAITLADLPNLELPLHLHGTTSGSLGDATIDCRNDSGDIGGINMTSVNYAKLEGGGGEHTHSIDPEHALWVVLVKL